MPKKESFTVEEWLKLYGMAVLVRDAASNLERAALDESASKFYEAREQILAELGAFGQYEPWVRYWVDRQP